METIQKNVHESNIFTISYIFLKSDIILPEKKGSERKSFRESLKMIEIFSSAVYR